MMKALATTAALLLLAGCISLSPPEDEFEAASMPPEETRIDGMTVEVTQTDAMVSCDDGDGGLLALPSACAERVVEASGRMGVDRLPVALHGSNGEILLRQSVDDTWSFTATVRVRGVSEDQAREGLDTAWEWGHEKEGGHAIYAGPTERVAILGVGPSVVASAYELVVPAWVQIDLMALTDNGGITAERFTFGEIDVETDNGEIRLSGEALRVRGRTDNGAITAALEPIGSGAWDLSTDNGQIVLSVPVGRRLGYDITGTTDNGQVVLDLGDGELETTEEGARFVTRGFAERAIQTTMTLVSDNGQIVVRSSD